jgi:hypothetical protein
MSSPSQHRLVAQSEDIHGDGNYLQGCSSVNDCRLRLYNTPAPAGHRPALPNTAGRAANDSDDKDDNNKVKSDNENALHRWNTALVAQSGDAVRSYTWYPPMMSSDPISCCFLAAARYAMTKLYCVVPAPDCSLGGYETHRCRLYFVSPLFSLSLGLQ